MKRIVLIAYVSLGCLVAHGQTADEALRYSELRFGGSARGMGVAGAFGAIGADFSSVLTNPGGLGLYRKSELAFSLRLDHVRTDSDYEGNSSYDDRFNFNIPNIGVVFARKRDQSRGWKFINFGLGYNRLTNFHSNSYYRSNSSSNSLLENYDRELTGIPEGEIGSSGGYSIESELAYFAWLVNADSSNSSTYNTVTDNALVNQQISVEKRGAIDELSFSVAANHRDKVYFGGYLGIPFLFYRERIRHNEQNNSSDSDNFNSFEQRRDLHTFGIGINFKLGVIYRPLDWLRLGIAAHTPTYYGMADEYTSSVSVRFDTLPQADLVFPLIATSEFDYNLVTPSRLVGSIGFIARKYAFFSFDYEYVNYGKARYKMDSQNTEFEMSLNDAISDLSGPANIYRAGVELALDKFRLRGGFAHYDSPYRDPGFLGSYDASINYYTFGAGLRFKKAFVDFAYVRSFSKSVFLTVNEVLALDETTTNRFMVTTGFKF